jgi:threonine aldolase
VGSVVVGDREFIARARRARKMVGGGMRQVGILAAAGLVALQDGPEGMIDRLADDHRNARHLAEGFAAMEGVVGLDPARVRTNYVVFGLRERSDRPPLEVRAELLAELERRGVLCIPYSHGRIRALTHAGIGSEDVDRVLDAMRGALVDVGLAPLTA